MAVESVLERTLPQSLDAEMSVIGAMLLDNEVINVVVPILNKQSFYKTAHQSIYQAIIDLYDKGQAIDLVLLREELKKRSLLENVGGAEYLVELEEAVPTIGNVEYYANIVRENAIKRNLIEVAANIQKQAFEGAVDTGFLLDSSERAIFEITQKKFNASSIKLNEILKETFSRIENLHDRESRLTGLSTGFYDFDDLTCGLQPSELVIVAARPSMGKTSFVMNIIEHIGVVEKKPAAIFSMEMSAQQLAQNMLCSHSKIDAHKLRKGFLEDDDRLWSALSNGLGSLSEAPIFIEDTPGLTVLEVRAKARRLKAQYDIQLIAVDYLQLMESPRGENRQQEISIISRGLKSLARELAIPVIAVSQLNRSVESREGHRPRMSDLRESGSIEQDADVIALLHREDYFNPEKKDGTAELIIAKQRNGPTGTIKLTFLSHCMRFENFSSSGIE
ncbi:replicative DNA helicase [Candidatus Kuenenia stuttgartiensis]|uniref:Replicative DNA helicase n=1 Tax=Kuenenia stuttgartiensis TaxID=174633 RepID=Q1Q7I3_KUEST|nr:MULTISPECIES: replicative DNA helicase [Kuenenia]MBE7548030.1 replicative DNA helicase [Planctomycetia bacterium]MBW7943224.1 replicative DNA helicase [Candidatus Kuenenia stuttgartiensis]MBZ0192238.1 replicative DNA helicase [Candidatus Kuenenia stuttgartiensis]MCF6152449.1 replicative DNA helicase [Candidatus Kuenenia stuttgartiensis]MCL4726662.1 replicative DNA helicase [Candidatus Kuenenia stuttgartiensis]